MILQRFYEDALAQASYLIGCAVSGEALMVDPNRDANRYIHAAESEGLRISHIVETHIHADFVSGTRDLASRTGAKIYLSDEGGMSWKYAFAERDGAVLLKDSDTFQVGNVRIQAVHTPGHTPEHLSFLITDTNVAHEPIGILTGDFVFVGDVGRPDLLETAARVEGAMQEGARTLFRSVQRFKEYADYLQILPGHGAGSACGKDISSVPTSTVGYEKRFNWAFSYENESAFVQAVLAGQPDPPRYFAQMKRINQEGPRILSGFPHPPRLAENRLKPLLEQGSLVIDARQATEYAAGHIPGTVNIPLNQSFATWAGWLIPYDRDFYLLIHDACAPCIDQAVRALTLIGLDRIAGYFGTRGARCVDGRGAPARYGSADYLKGSRGTDAHQSGERSGRARPRGVGSGSSPWGREHPGGASGGPAGRDLAGETRRGPLPGRCTLRHCREPVAFQGVRKCDESRGRLR